MAKATITGNDDGSATIRFDFTADEVEASGIRAGSEVSVDTAPPAVPVDEAPAEPGPFQPPAA